MSEHIIKVRQLYKLILRLHRGLPEELRVLGDTYAKDEFKRHKNCNQEEACIFFDEWRDYAVTIARQLEPERTQRPAMEQEASQSCAAAVGVRAVEAPARRYGQEIPVNRFVYLNPEQLIQMARIHGLVRGNVAEDEGIELMAADALNKKLQDAKQHLIKLAEYERGRLARGEITKEDLQTITPSWWLEIFDNVMALHDAKTPEDLKGLTFEPEDLPLVDGKPTLGQNRANLAWARDEAKLASAQDKVKPTHTHSSKNKDK